MKKLLIFICVAVSMLSAISFYGCENNGNGGVIDGNYVPVTQQSYEKNVATIDGESPVAGSDTAFGGTLTSNLALNFTIGESSARISENETLKLQYLNELLKMSLTGEVNVTAGEDFSDGLILMITELLSLPQSEDTPDIGALNATGRIEAFFDDAVLYLNARLNGLSERQKELLREEDFDVDETGIEDGIRYRLADTDVKETAMETVGSMVGLISETLREIKTVDYETVQDYMTLFDINFDIDDMEEGFNVRLKTTEGTAAKLRAWANENDDDLKEFFDFATLDTLDVTLYLSFDGYGKLVKIAANGDVSLSFTAGETPVTAGISGSATLSFAIPKIDFPDFTDYVDPAGNNGDTENPQENLEVITP